MARAWQLEPGCGSFSVPPLGRGVALGRCTQVGRGRRCGASIASCPWSPGPRPPALPLLRGAVSGYLPRTRSPGLSLTFGAAGQDSVLPPETRPVPVGTFAVMSVMVGSVTESLAPDENFLQAPNATVNETARDAERVQLASTLSVLVGLFQVWGSRECVSPVARPPPNPLPPP